MAWKDRVTFINNLGALAGFNIANQYAYTDAVGYPDGPTVVYYSGVDTEGIPGPPTALNVGTNGMVGYLLSRVKMHFQSNPYLELEQGTLSLEGSNQDIELPTNLNSYFFNGNTSHPVDSSQIPAIQGSFLAIVWEAFNLASIPLATAEAAVAAPIDQSGAFGTDSSNGGTLKFTGFHFDRRVAQNGQEMWSARYTLLYNPFGWNRVFWPTNQGGMDSFVPVQDASGNYPIPLDMAGNIPSLLGNTAF